MKQGGYLVFIVVGFIFLLGTIILIKKGGSQQSISYIQPPIKPFVQPSQPGPIQLPTSQAPMRYLDYEGVVNLLKQWNRESPEITEVGSYGKSSRGEDIWYFRLHNSRVVGPKKKVLVTACIHGDEKISTATLLGCMSKMLHTFNELDLSDRDIYFVPVVSPDSYKSHRRHVDGVDPNRDFPHARNPDKRSVAPIAALRGFFKRHNFDAAVCGHAYGHVFIYPSGQGATANDADYRRICNKMTELAGYNRPYRSRNVGTSKDFYHNNGAFGITWEFGSSKKPSESAIPREIAKAYLAMLYFIQEAPLVQIS